MVNWRRGGVCPHWYLCILLYVQLSQCSGLPEIFGQLEEGVGFVCNGVVVFQRCMVDWRRGWGLSALVSVHSSICET